MSTYLPSAVSTIRTDAFDRQVDRLFSEALRSFGASDQPWAPAANAWEDDNGFYVQMALPGWDPKNINVEVDNHVLTVQGERHVELQNSEKFHLREIADGQFTRRFRLPSFVEHDKASATQKHGLLTIAFPKREEAKCRRIMIEES
ncbi:MAG: heat-shock protein Hsp20 [Nitrospira sp. WS110]|nr:heat-shock protein Hsp20 [Nitrospira sp. WS110]